MEGVKEFGVDSGEERKHELVTFRPEYLGFEQKSLFTDSISRGTSRFP